MMIPAFLCSLCGGMLAVLAVSRIESVAWKFVRLIGLIAFALAAGVGVWSIMTGRLSTGDSDLVAGAFAIACAVAAIPVIFLAPFVKSKTRPIRAAAGFGGFCGIASASTWSMITTAATTADVPAFNLLNGVGQVLGAFLLGSVTVAWLLGHAYLTATTMTMVPLKRLSRLFSIAVGLRVVFLVGCMLVAYASDTPGGRSLMGLITNVWLIVSLRVAVGLLAVGVFAYMVSDCVKLRSTQSATGILYFASVFVYIGELASQHLVGALGFAV
jgi:uncharacterized membrane protein